MMSSPYFFSLDSIKPQNFAGGSVTHVTKDEMPGLVNLSFSALKLKENAHQEPLWHPNANKIGCCLQGDALISIRSPAGNDVFTVAAGDVFFIPQGYVHHIANNGKNELIIAFACNHAKPQEMLLSKAVYSLNDTVFSSTFNTNPDFFKGIKKNGDQDLIKTLPSTKGPVGFISSRYKFNIASSSKPIQTKGGYLQLAIKSNLPILDGLGILGFGLNPHGIVEPHWHTNAGELVYIVKGKTRITVLSPDGKVDVLNVNAGEGAFAPASFFHNIENVGTENVEVVAFFSHADPDYIGIGEAIGSYSNDVLGSLFNVTPDYFETLKKPGGPLVIVPV